MSVNQQHRQEELWPMDTNSSEASDRNKASNTISYLAEPRKENSYVPVASLVLLNKYRRQLKRSRRCEANKQSPQMTARASNHQVLSAESISRLAKMKLQEESRRIDGLLPLKESHEAHEDVDNDFRDIELALNLTLAAEKISNRDFDGAEMLLSICHHVPEITATPVQKVVHYFAEALQEKIDINKGQIDLEKKTVQIEEFPNCEQPVKIACEVDLPFNQITGFVATQAIMESVGSAARIHIIDFFSVGSGSHWAILMQAIANRGNCPLELLKITSVGVSKNMIEETGRWLSSFAESMNLPFSFNAVLSELEDFKIDFVELKAGEVVAVYLNACLWPLLARPDSLNAFTLAINNLSPCLMVVGEIEANTNTSVFLHRFHEALFYCSAIFDCCQSCLTDSQFRNVTEEANIRNAIRDVVISEDEERIYRHGKIDFWREFFSTFGLVEMELSYASLFQASLLLKSCSCWSSCTINMNGKSMIVEWKGTPINSISAWKFCHD